MENQFSFDRWHPFKNRFRDPLSLNFRKDIGPDLGCVKRPVKLYSYRSGKILQCSIGNGIVPDNPGTFKQVNTQENDHGDYDHVNQNYFIVPDGRDYG